jgi:tetratricopeptide (TPR) repeat protein
MTIKELFDQFIEIKSSKNSKLCIDTFEANLDLINNVDLTNLADYDCIMIIISDYALVLSYSGYYKKSIQYFDKAIDLFEKFPNFDKDKLFNIPYYETIVFQKAVTLNNLKYYKDSLLLFQKLHFAFPDNDRYSNWIDSIKIVKLDINSAIWFVVTFLIMILRIPLKSKDLALCEILLYIATGTFFIAIINVIKRYIIAIRKRKK